LRTFYAKQQKQKDNNNKRIQRLKKFSLVINPLICLGFVLMFWFLGIMEYYRDV
jgi:hypothetical protein